VKHVSATNDAFDALTGRLFNYFHRSISYLASVRIQLSYRGSREQRLRKRHELQEITRMNAKRSSDAPVLIILDVVPDKRTGVCWLRSTSTFMSWSRLDCNCYCKYNDWSRPSSAGASAHEFSQHVMWQLTLPHSLERIPTAITDRILFSDYIAGRRTRQIRFFIHSEENWHAY